MDEINEACSIQADEELENHPEIFEDEVPVVEVVAEPPSVVTTLIMENVECKSNDE
jgi:hypothetical protein